MTNNFFEKQTLSSKIKAEIVANYFPKYCKILLKSVQKEIRYLDLFSGPGVYEDGSLSTPILIGKACEKDPELRTKVQLLFNDNEQIEKLKINFSKHFKEGTFSFKPRFGDKTVGEDLAITKYLTKKNIERKNPFPTLLFFDPFGYKGINTKILAGFMNNWGNEIFLFFNIKRIHAAVENKKFDEMMLELFPTTYEIIRKDRKYVSTTAERLALIIENLANEYKTLIPKVFHTAFKFQEEDNIGTSHYIIHFTKHERGFDLIKQIYNDFDNIGATLGLDGNYTFDAKKLDTDPNSFLDFGDENIEFLSNQLLTRFKGKRLSAYKIFEQHHSTGNFCRKHYSDTLRDMSIKGLIRPHFTDGKNHSVSVLITESCIIDFL